MARAFDGIDALLAALRERRVPMAMMTGKGRRSTAITLAALGWERTFHPVITGEDIERQKPDPEGALRAAHELGVAPARCAFVGDSPADIGAARAAGMIAVVAGWHSVYADKLRAMDPHAWARTPADVLELIGPGRDSFSPSGA
jgi:beta-phosphoglucomutase-like phosphatase (HAD superfamily)